MFFKAHRAAGEPGVYEVTPVRELLFKLLLFFIKTALHAPSAQL